MTFETRLDTSDLNELGRAAVWYCENGFAVFPLHARSKKPAMDDGLNGWFNDPQSAYELWERFPDYNIGITCGTPSHGLLVLDFDEDDDEGVHGLDSLADWETAHGELPRTACVTTGRGGSHYLYRTDRTNIRPSANHELGIDIRCDGSYIVAPPSIHPNGNPYTWDANDAPWERRIAIANGNVLDLLDYVQRNGGTDDTVKENGKFRLPDRIGKGARDNTLFRYAAHLRAIGRSDEEILNAVIGVNFTRCEPPIDSADVRRIVKSACRYERGEHSDTERAVGAPGTSDPNTDKLPSFRTARGAIIHNKLARIMLERNHACKIDGAPAIWTGERWEFGKQAIAKVAIAYADDIKKAARDEVYSYIAAQAPDKTSMTDFDGRYYIQFANETVDVLSGVTVTPEPSMLIVGRLPVGYDPLAEDDAVDAFLDSLANGDEGVTRVLSEIVGACMVSRRVLSQSPMLVGKANMTGGEASNGKSTYINVIRALLGANNVSSLDVATLGQRFQAGRVIGKLANLGDDIPNGFLHGDELSVFKKLVTGEEIYTDVKNAEGIEFRPSATFVFSMNSMPRLADTTDGIFRRLAFVPFRNRFSPGMPNFDPDMERKMCRPDALRRLAVLGLMALPALIERRTLTPLPEMVAEVERIRIDNDVVRRWIYSEMVEDSDIIGQYSTDLYDKFKNWARDAQEKAVSKSTFTQRILTTHDYITTIRTCDRPLGKQGTKFIRRQTELELTTDEADL